MKHTKNSGPYKTIKTTHIFLKFSSFVCVFDLGNEKL